MRALVDIGIAIEDGSPFQKVSTAEVNVKAEKTPWGYKIRIPEAVVLIPEGLMDIERFITE